MGIGWQPTDLGGAVTIQNSPRCPSGSAMNASIAPAHLQPNPLAQRLEAGLALQRAAYFQHPVPSLAERRADLRTLQRFLRENKDALCEAISADYGHRSRHESLLAEMFPAIDGVDHVIKHLRGWMKPQRRKVEARERIQERPMPARVQEAPVIMLAVQFHQMIGQIAQHLARDTAVVDEGGLAPVGGIDPAQDQLVLGLDSGLVKHPARRMTQRQVEDRRHLALPRALADQFRPAAPAQHEPQRIQEDRLARPRLAGQHVQSRPKLQAQPVDDQHIADVQTTQHRHSRGG